MSFNLQLATSKQASGNNSSSASTHSPSDMQALINLAQQILHTPYLKPSSTPSNSKPYRLESRLSLHRAGHQIHFICHKGQNYVFKVFADLGKYSPKHFSFSRRLGFFFNNWIKNPAQKSYQGALALRREGLPTLEPVAYIWRRYGLHRRGLLIYRKLEAQHSLQSWLASDLNPSQQKQSLQQLAQIVCRLEKSDLAVGDFKLDNLLVIQQPNATFTIKLIDTDEVTTSWRKKITLPRWAQKINVMWALRRIKLNPWLSKKFLQLLYQTSDIQSEYQLWLKLRRFQPNPIKALRRALRRALKKTKHSQ